MRIPIITSDPALLERIAATVRDCNAGEGLRRRRSDQYHLQPVPLDEASRALDYINYHMPPLVLIDVSDERIDSLELMRGIAADPWLNHGGLIAFYERSSAYNELNEFRDTNLIIALGYTHIDSLLPKVLRIVTSNTQILFQRAIHTDLLSSVTGQFTLGMDILLVPCYANLVANYLYNVGVVSPEAKLNVALVLTEMLTNAIEHGNCEIGSKEKAAYLGNHFSLQHILEEKCRDPAIAQRKVQFHYDIQRDHSRYVIRDEGPGFDWRSYLDKQREMDFLAEHGRGIMLATQAADEIRYNEPGNEVTLVFRHRTSTTNTVPRALKNNEILECRPEDVIFRQGEESTFLYYVAEGEFRVDVNGHTVAYITPDDMLMGEMSFLLEETRSATVVATTPGRLIRISKEDFINIIKHQPYYGLFLSKLLAQRLHRLSRGVVS